MNCTKNTANNENDYIILNDNIFEIFKDFHGFGVKLQQNHTKKEIFAHPTKKTRRFLGNKQFHGGSPSKKFVFISLYCFFYILLQIYNNE